MFVQGGSPHIPFPPDLILYVNFGAKGAPKFIKPLGPTAYSIGNPLHRYAYCGNVSPIELHNF